ncbi:SLOG family protein [Clostridium perfringens]|uniref:SLOG family protein n=1 Tax=Clostridium perfringens TaxID=1502 RepID=UPI00096AADB0|nr:SLOG family protein [Clostridium perfringens]
MKICFTGHRPEKLDGYNWSTSKSLRIMLKLLRVIEEQIQEHKKEEITFICGGALGIDQMAFHLCNQLKAKYFNIKTELAIPFLKQASRWVSDTDIKRYQEHKKLADRVVYVDELEQYRFDKVSIGEYHSAKMQIRNKFMVDNSDLVIAVWDKSKGGTYNCVKYAEKLGKKIIIIDPSEI